MTDEQTDERTDMGQSIGPISVGPKRFLSVEPISEDFSSGKMGNWTNLKLFDTFYLKTSILVKWIFLQGNLSCQTIFLTESLILTGFRWLREIQASSRLWEIAKNQKRVCLFFLYFFCLEPFSTTPWATPAIMITLRFHPGQNDHRGGSKAWLIVLECLVFLWLSLAALWVFLGVRVSVRVGASLCVCVCVCVCGCLRVYVHEWV